MRATKNRIKIKAIDHYLSGRTLEQTAKFFNVHRNTIWRWVRTWRRGGKESVFFDAARRHWKRLPEDNENAVIALKEYSPGCTVRHAQARLKDQNLMVSIKGIWSIWKRHGLTGFARLEISHAYQDYLRRIVPSGVQDRINTLIQKNELQKAADIVNSLPLFPYNEIILQIPGRMLSLRRQIDRIQAEFGQIPLSRYRRKAQVLRRKLEDRDLNYSSLWVAIAECYALMWSGLPHEVLRQVSMIKKKTAGIRDARLRFIVLMLEGQANAVLMRITQAKSCVDQCKIIARTSRNPHFFMGGIGGIYSTMGYYREAIHWTDRALRGAAPSYQQQLYANIAQFYGTSGNYRAALPVLKKAQLEEWGFQSRGSLIRACSYLDRGDFHKALEYAIDTLMKAKKEGVRSLLHPATLILASCHRAAGEKAKANAMLKEIVPLLSKYRLKQEYWLRRIVLGDAPAPKKALQVPGLRLAYLLCRARRSARGHDYRLAYAYAQRKKILGIFMRLIPFFPEPVRRLLEKGSNTHLPRAFLDMPVFQVDAPVFRVLFLGKCQVQKQEKLLRHLALGPKDTAFLVHISLNKNRRIGLKELYDNFWPGSEHPARNLSHALTRLRKNLAIPAHLMRIRTGVLYWNISFSTDYDEFKEHIAKARFFEQADERDYAEREYQRARRLYRGEPFKGMYDNWSEQMRREIMTARDKC